MLKHFLIRIVGFSCRHARFIVPAAAACAVALAWYTVGNLRMDTDTDRLFPNDLSWRQREIDFKQAFPHNTALLAIVIEAATPARADRAADALMQRLSGLTGPFKSIRRPDGGDFFRRNGLLYLSTEELEDFAAQVAEVQPFLGTLSADPSLGGLFSMLAQAVEAVQDGEFSA
ncbi:MAG: MMPL family transporter, partial [Gammaproteobacteria bacterium]